MRRIDSEVDGHWGNPFVGASNTVCFSLNLQTDLLKICELLSFAVQEFSILCAGIDQLQDQRTPGHNARATWQKVPPDEILQHRALAGALPPDHGDLRQVEVSVLPDGGEGVLQPVDQRDQILHPAVPHGGGDVALLSR